MRKVLLVVVLVVTLFAVVSLARPYTSIPWPYGAMILVQTPSIDQQQFVDQATRAVGDVFSFWNMTTPTPTPGWATPTQTDSQVYSYTWSRILTQSPSLMLPRVFGSSQGTSGALQEANPFLSPWREEYGTEFPGEDEQHVMLVPCPTWRGWRIMPLTIGVFPARESLDRLFKDYTFSAFFGGVSWYTAERAQDTGQEDRYEFLRLFPYEATVIMPAQHNIQLLLHELSHWASWLWCERNGGELSSLPRLIIEGFASYTADSLTHDDSWRTIAAAWAQQGGDLADVPRPLTYEVGTNIVSLLVHEKGKDGFLEMLSDPAVDWDAVIPSLTPKWRASLADVVFSAGDMPMYRAVLQSLALCHNLLVPVLPCEAYYIVDRLYDGCGTMEHVDRFWKLVSQIPPKPSEEIWQEMIARIASFMIVQSRDSDPDVRMVSARLQVKLEKYADNRDWESFYATFIEALREVVAHYGTGQRAEVSSEETK